MNRTGKISVDVTAADRRAAEAVGVAILRELGKRGAAKLQRPEAPLCEAAIQATLAERHRVVTMLDEMARAAMAAGNRSGSTAAAAVAAGDVAAAVRFKSEEVQHRLRAEVVVFMMHQVVRDPDACQECGGSGEVPSTIAPGQNVSCPKCSDPSTDAEGSA